MLTNQTKLEKNIGLFWEISIFSFLAVIFIAMPGIAGATGSSSFCSVLSTVLSYLTGTPAKLIATFAICFLGIAAFFGKLQWGTAMLVAVGIALIFGAAGLVQIFAGSGMACT